VVAALAPTPIIIITDAQRLFFFFWLLLVTGADPTDIGFISPDSRSPPPSSSDSFGSPLGRLMAVGNSSELATKKTITVFYSTRFGFSQSAEAQLSLRKVTLAKIVSSMTSSISQ